jgi:prephenate dehydrogenase
VILDPKQPKHQAALCANGFRDTTRIASGSPEMWRDIALTNSKHLARALAGLVSELGRFRSALQRGDAPAIAKFFETAKQRRDNWRTSCISPSPE